MRKILVLGAGRSSPALINYLIDKAPEEQWEVTVADASLSGAAGRIGRRSRARAVALDIRDEESRNRLIRQADLVVSLLPPALHFLAAKCCLRFRKHLLTASYADPQIRSLHREAVRAGILFLNETGLDPGIDHMSAMKAIESIRGMAGCRLTSFRSYAGGLVAPESDDNPWNYKFTWNPANVVRAGQGTARYIRDGKLHFLPHNRLFSLAERVSVGRLGTFDAYANRDSLAYMEPYGLEGVSTLMRGTLRRTGFCRAWDVFVRLGLTDDSFVIENCHRLSYAELVEAFLPYALRGTSLKARLARFCGLAPAGEVIRKIAWTGILGTGRIRLRNATPAAILQDLLEPKWKFKRGDRDMVVMAHFFEFENRNRRRRKKVLHSWMSLEGKPGMTAMAMTVGLPLGIAARLLLNGKVHTRGVAIPVTRELYDPILAELETFGIRFHEKTVS